MSAVAFLGIPSTYSNQGCTKIATAENSYCDVYSISNSIFIEFFNNFRIETTDSLCLITKSDT
jgi:hypothetical protein